MTETKIYLIRHGEINNPGDVYYGTLPGPEFRLSNEGIEHVNDLSVILKQRGVKFDAVYTSPLERAFQSARVIAETFGTEVKEAPKLIDTYLPALEGKPMDILRSRGFGNEYSKEFRTPGSETAKDVILRTRDFLNEVKLRHNGGSIALVSHGDQIRFMLWELQNPGKDPDLEKLRDKDYPEPAEAIELRFGASGEFLGFEHIRREKGSLRESDPSGNRLKEA